MRILPYDSEFGCGWGPFRTSSNDSFHNSCVIHDIRFEQQYLQTQAIPMTRKEADTEFLNNMLSQANDSILLKLKAYLYYGTVRTFGGLFW